MATHKNNEWKWEVIRKFARVREGKKRNFFNCEWMSFSLTSSLISFQHVLLFFPISSFAHFHFRFSSVRRCWVENSTSWAVFPLLSPMSSPMCAFFFALSILERDWVKKRNLWWDDSLLLFSFRWLRCVWWKFIHGYSLFLFVFGYLNLMFLLCAEVHSNAEKMPRNSFKMRI